MAGTRFTAPGGPMSAEAVAPSASIRDRPLVVVSNRLPCRAERSAGGGIAVTRSPGGLVSALEPVLAQRGGVWVGWAGTAKEETEEAGGMAMPASDLVRYRQGALTAPRGGPD